jgi:hypothetical protein
MKQDLPSTIRNPDTFRRAAPAGFDGVFDWSWTQGCFGQTKITPMDLDGIIERKGQFLLFETKDVGVQIPQGQLITLQSLHKLNVFTVMIIHGKELPEVSHCWYPNSKAKVTLNGANEAARFVSRWFLWADKR